MPSKRVCVIDAGPIIHLDELGVLEWLHHMGEIFVPESVAYEAEKHRRGVTAKLAGHIVAEAEFMSRKLADVIRLHDLHTGEIAALAWVEKFGADLFVSDDRAARAASDDLGYESTGTLGVITNATEAGVISRTDAIGLIESVRNRSTLHASTALLQKVIARLR